ncbi:MAG: PqqD family protein [Kiritimatiellia bacterium]
MGRGSLTMSERKIRLDELGGYVFKLVDQQRTTLEIIEKFAGHYRLNRREATLSTVEFLKSLVKRGVISILIK